MHFTPREQEKLMLYMAGSVARDRLNRGMKLNYPETVALISAELLERAREGMTVTELMHYGTKILRADQVMDGVPEMLTEVQIEATFPDGTKLVTVHNPIEPEYRLIPGEILTDEGEILLNEGKPETELEVTNTGDRPIQVGSHFHFFEVNKLLSFDREAAFGKRLDIPSGTAVRFEPGERKTVRLIPLGGERCVYGLNDLTCGAMDDPLVKQNAWKRAKEQGFKGASGI